MSIAALLRDVDADELQALKDIGAIDETSYTPPGDNQTAIPCDVYVEDVKLEGVGETAQTVAPVRLVEFKREQVSPVRGGTVVIDAATYRLESLFKHDSAKSVWTVNRVRA